MFDATGFSGVSEPDDIDEVEDGDNRDELVVKPSGKPTLFTLEDAVAESGLEMIAPPGLIALLFPWAVPMKPAPKLLE